MTVLRRVRIAFRYKSKAARRESYAVYVSAASVLRSILRDRALLPAVARLDAPSVHNIQLTIRLLDKAIHDPRRDYRVVVKNILDALSAIGPAIRSDSICRDAVIQMADAALLLCVPDYFDTPDRKAPPNLHRLLDLLLLLFPKCYRDEFGNELLLVTEDKCKHVFAERGEFAYYRTVVHHGAAMMFEALRSHAERWSILKWFRFT